MIFMAGGYTPARLMPVRTRRIRAGPTLSTHDAKAALKPAPATALPIMSRRDDQTSGRLPSADTSVPTMKPS
jgi:hypothetical protein